MAWSTEYRAEYMKKYRAEHRKELNANRRYYYKRNKDRFKEYYEKERRMRGASDVKRSAV
jgi:hypothetical protein